MKEQNNLLEHCPIGVVSARGYSMVLGLKSREHLRLESLSLSPVPIDPVSWSKVSSVNEGGAKIREGARSCFVAIVFSAFCDDWSVKDERFYYPAK